MKLTLAELRQIITEEYLRGVPEFQFQEASRKFCDEIKKHVQSFILLDKSSSREEQQDAIGAMNEQMAKLEEEVNALVEEKLWAFMSHV